MPIVRIANALVYYAHVPKCAGSSVEDYLARRFGPLAFLDRRHLAIPEPARWSRTSPQHADWAAIERLFPPGFLTAAFAVVRHPLDRAVSAYRFQAEVEGTVPDGMGFGEWLDAEARARAETPYRSDNHSRPQVDFLPPENTLPCQIFHLEHGLDALIPWLDTLAGNQDGPRAMGHANEAGALRRKDIGPVTPTPEDHAKIAKIYAQDFQRLNYTTNQKTPLAQPPKLDPEFLAKAANARARAASPLGRLAARLRRGLEKRRHGGG